MTPSPDIDLEMINLRAESSADEFHQRWTVYLAKGTTSFVAPAVPVGFEDPFAAANVLADHLGFELTPGVTPDALVQHDSTTLNDLILRFDGLTYEHVILPNP